MVPAGWVCPLCTRVHAPSVRECGPCNGTIHRKRWAGDHVEINPAPGPAIRRPIVDADQFAEACDDVYADGIEDVEPDLTVEAPEVVDREAPRIADAAEICDHGRHIWVWSTDRGVICANPGCNTVMAGTNTGHLAEEP